MFKGERGKEIRGKNEGGAETDGNVWGRVSAALQGVGCLSNRSLFYIVPVVTTLIFLKGV